MIELILAEDIMDIAKSGDSVILKDDNTFEIKKDKYPKDYIPDYDEPITRTERDKDGKSLEKEFADYKDFADCVSKNKDKTDPDAYCGSIKHKVEDVKKYDTRIDKYLPGDKAKAWTILEKFHKTNKHFDANTVLKDFLNKVATCPDVTDKFEKIMEGWMRDGEADIAPLEKIINSCKTEGGNVVVEGEDKVAKGKKDVFNQDAFTSHDEHPGKRVDIKSKPVFDNFKGQNEEPKKPVEDVSKAERSPEQLRQMEVARKRQQADDEDTKIKPIGKTAEIVEAISKLH